MIHQNDFSKSYVLYKSRNDGNGSVSRWNLASNKDSVFLEMTNQKGKDDKGNASFDWENKVGFKLGPNDIGEILAVLAGLQEGVGPFDPTKKKHKGLYHSNANGNSILYFAKDNIGKFRIYLTVKRSEEHIIVQHVVTKGEACILSTLLRKAVEIIYLWH